MSTTDKILSCMPATKIKILFGSEFFAKETHPDMNKIIDNGLCYETYFAIGKYYQLNSIMEIGVRFGWSLAAMAAGSNCAIADGIDSQWDMIPVEEVEVHLNLLKSKGFSQNTKFSIKKCNSQSIETFSQEYDLVHIDSDQAFSSVQHDLRLALTAKPKIIMVDDYFSEIGVKNAVHEFAAKQKDLINEAFVMYNGGITGAEKGLAIFNMKDYVLRE